jgi:NADH:ubiquinone oxidoreductase subunit 4 (subunit M)
MGCLFIGVVSIVGGRLARVITIIQVDIKSLIAYSRIVHISIITLAILFNTLFAPLAGLIILIGHGLCSSGLFYLGTINYERFASRRMVTTRGILMIIPSLAIIWRFLILINLSAPPSLTLLSEILIIYTGIALN